MTASRTELAATWPPTASVAGEAGHAQMSPLSAIRKKCLDCCAEQVSEIRLCEAVKCALWPFRSGQHPYTAAKLKNGLQQVDYPESGAIQTKGPVEAATSPSHRSTRLEIRK